MSAALPVAIAEALWLAELFERIDLMNHAVAVHASLLSELTDDAEIEVPLTELIRRTHDVCELREKIGDRTSIEDRAREILAEFEDLTDIRRIESALSDAHAAGYRNGFAAARLAVRRQPWFQFLCALCAWAKSKEDSA